MISEYHQKFMNSIKDHSHISNARSLGTLLAFDIKTVGKPGYLNDIRDQVISFFLKKDILILPLGNVMYALPPYCTGKADLDYLYKIITEFLDNERIFKT